MQQNTFFLSRFPTDPFTALELQNLSNDVPELHKIRWSTKRLQNCERAGRVVIKFASKTPTDQTRDQTVSELESVRIGNSQNWKVSELEIVRIGKCQNWKVSELESVRIGNSQNWKVSELESVRIGNSQNWKVTGLSDTFQFLPKWAKNGF